MALRSLHCLSAALLTTFQGNTHSRCGHCHWSFRRLSADCIRSLSSTTDSQHPVTTVRLTSLCWCDSSLWSWAFSTMDPLQRRTLLAGGRRPRQLGRNLCDYFPSSCRLLLRYIRDGLFHAATGPLAVDRNWNIGMLRVLRSTSRLASVERWAGAESHYKFPFIDSLTNIQRDFHVVCYRERTATVWGNMYLSYIPHRCLKKTKNKNYSKYRG